MHGSMGNICVQTDAIRGALFWVICSFCMCDSAVADCLTNWPYKSMDLMHCLYTRVLSSLDCLNAVLASASRKLSRVSALVVLILSVYGLNVIPLS